MYENNEFESNQVKIIDFSSIKNLNLPLEEMYRWTEEVWEQQDDFILVPAPWWKTDYFEVRFERQEENKRYFYQLDGGRNSV